MHTDELSQPEHYKYGRTRAARRGRLPHVRRAMEAALDAVSFEFKVAQETMRGRVRTRPVAEARHAAVAIARAIEPRASTPLLGVCLWRHHNSVLVSLQRAKELAAVDPLFRGRFNAAKEAAQRLLLRHVLIVDELPAGRAEA